MKTLIELEKKWHEKRRKELNKKISLVTYFPGETRLVNLLGQPIDLVAEKTCRIFGSKLEKVMLHKIFNEENKETIRSILFNQLTEFYYQREIDRDLYEAIEPYCFPISWRSLVLGFKLKSNDVICPFCGGSWFYFGFDKKHVMTVIIKTKGCDKMFLHECWENTDKHSFGCKEVKANK